VHRPRVRNFNLRFTNVIVKAMQMQDRIPEDETLNLGKYLGTINQRVARLH